MIADSKSDDGFLSNCIIQKVCKGAEDAFPSSLGFAIFNLTPTCDTENGS